MDEMNVDFLDKLDFNWKAVFDDERYTLVNPDIEAILKGRSVTATQEFFTDFSGHYLQDEAENESRTALNAYTELAEGTGYTFILVDNFGATTLNYQKNQSKMERFNYYNERYKAEFRISGKFIYLYHKIGSYKPYVRIDEDLNVKSAKITKDTKSFWTWCKCFYDKEEGTEGEEEVYRKSKVYRNEAFIDVYGEIEGPAIYQGNILYEDVMMEFAQASHEASYSVSHEVELIDLRRQGYDEFTFNEGDTVRLSLQSVDEVIDIRIIKIDETFVENEMGEMELIELKLTLGNENVVQASKNNSRDVLLDLDDWINERRPAPLSILAPAARRAFDIINGDKDSVMEYRKDRLIGHRDKNKGDNVQLNVSGLVFVKDGVPRSALTPDGLIVDHTTTGSLYTNNVLIQGTNGLLTIDGDVFTMRNTSGSLSTIIRPGFLSMSDSQFELGGGADIHFLNSGNRLYFIRNEWASGLGVGLSINNHFPNVFLGVSRGSRPNANDITNFSGFIANANDREDIDNVGNSAVGNRFHVRDIALAYSKGFTFNIQHDSNPRFYPMNTNLEDYYLGTSGNSWAQIHGTLVGTSSHNSKMNIEDLDSREAFDYFDQMKVKTYYYRDKDYTNKYNRKAGPIIEQLDPVNANLYKASDNALDINSNLFMLVLAWQHDKKQKDEKIKELERRMEAYENAS